MTDVQWRKVLGLVGLGARARTTVVGVELVRTAAMRDRLALVIVARDASRHSIAKVVPLMTARRVNVIEGRSAAELGAAVGKGPTAAVVSGVYRKRGGGNNKYKADNVTQSIAWQ
jgi:ribosomal protein L7Ae-like RNA K-turn-binding protein